MQTHACMPCLLRHVYHEQVHRYAQLQTVQDAPATGDKIVLLTVVVCEQHITSVNFDKAEQIGPLREVRFNRAAGFSSKCRIGGGAIKAFHEGIQDAHARLKQKPSRSPVCLAWFKVSSSKAWQRCRYETGLNERNSGGRKKVQRRFRRGSIGVGGSMWLASYVQNNLSTQAEFS